MNRWWMSFWFVGDDCRPLCYPPVDPILGWWVTGSDMAGRSSLCILVEANTEAAAKTIIAVEWPESTKAEWRFATKKDADWLPTADRFERSDWMKERMKQERKEPS